MARMADRTKPRWLIGSGLATDVELVGVVDEVGAALPVSYEPPEEHRARAADSVDVGDAVRALKADGGGELQVHGSAGLIQTLLAEDLVDELRLIVFPVTVGEGKRLFGEGSSPRTWRLATQKVSSTGAIMATYERVGDLETGNFVPE